MFVFMSDFLVKLLSGSFVFSLKCVFLFLKDALIQPHLSLALCKEKFLASTTQTECILMT